MNVLEEPSEYQLFDMPIKAAVMKCLRQGRLDIALSRVCAGYIFKSEKNKAHLNKELWRYLSKSLQNISKKYDVAVGIRKEPSLLLYRQSKCE